MKAEELFQQFIENPTPHQAQALQNTYPDHAYSDFATAYLALNQHQHLFAIQFFGQAYQKDNTLWQALFHRARALLHVHRVVEAAADYEHILHRFPHALEIWQRLLPLWHTFGEQERLFTALQFLTGPESQKIWSHHPDYALWCARLDALAMQIAFCNTQVSTNQLWQQAKAWYQKHLRPLAVAPPQPLPQVKPTSLRIAYVSNEWQSIPLKLIYEPVFAYHATQQTHKIYALGPEAPGPDLRPYFEDYLPLSQLTDQFDIFVDLSGWFYPEGFFALHHFPHRLKILLGLNPPFLGPGPLFDAIITDPYILPRSLQRQLPSLCLEDTCFIHWQPGPTLPQNVAQAQANAYQAKSKPDPDKGFRLGATASPNKINAETLTLWAKTLKGLPPQSQLTLKGYYYHDPLLQRRMRQAFTQAGGQAQQLVFEDNTRRSDYYPFYLEQDLILDSTPYNGALSNCDAYWAGTPVVSLDTQRGIARSLCYNTQTPELLAETAEEFVHKVHRCLKPRTRLVHYAYHLPQQLWQSVICEGLSFGERLEKRYLQLWQEKQQKNR